MLDTSWFQKDRMNLEMTAKTNRKGCADASPNYFDDLQAEHQRLHACPWIPLMKTQAWFAKFPNETYFLNSFARQTPPLPLRGKNLDPCHCKLTFSSVWEEVDTSSVARECLQRMSATKQEMAGWAARQHLDQVEVEMEVGTWRVDFPNDNGRLIDFVKFDHSSDIPLHAATVPTVADHAHGLIPWKHLVCECLMNDTEGDLHPGPYRHYLASE